MQFMIRTALIRMAALAYKPSFRTKQIADRDTALWFLTCMFNCPEALVLTPDMLSEQIKCAGFKNVEVRDLIPGLTETILAEKA